MGLRELMIEYILFAFSEEELERDYQIGEEEVYNMADIDLLELYDQALLSPVKE